MWTGYLVTSVRVMCRLVHSWGVYVREWHAGVFNAVRVVCACAVNKGAAERWLSPRDPQESLTSHGLMTELGSSV